MKRLTTDDEKSIMFFFNTFYAKDGEVWVRGGGQGPDYQDVTLVQWIRLAASKHGLDIIADDPESLGDEMYDALQYGDDAVEGIVALLHAAAVQAAEMRGRLQLIEDVLGAEYDMEHLRELMAADRAGRIKILPEATGQTCGTCANFIRKPGRKSGACKVRKFYKDRRGNEDHMRGKFEPSQSRKACREYKTAEPESLAKVLKDMFFCRRNSRCTEICSKCDDYGECYACVSCGGQDRCQVCERNYTNEQLAKIRSGEDVVSGKKNNYNV